MMWISVKDRLPDYSDDDFVIVYSGAPDSLDMVYIPDFFKDVPVRVGGVVLRYTKMYKSKGVTHWMSLPNPPSNSKAGVFEQNLDVVLTDVRTAMLQKNDKSVSIYLDRNLVATREVDGCFVDATGHLGDKRPPKAARKKRRVAVIMLNDFPQCVTSIEGAEQVKNRVSADYDAKIKNIHGTARHWQIREVPSEIGVKNQDDRTPTRRRRPSARGPAESPTTFTRTKRN
jgi:hypothetical protein